MAGLEHPPMLAFAPEAHLPAERRLLIESSGVVLMLDHGVRHRFWWTDCEAILCWPDRIELVLNSEVSLLVREADWHRGAEAIRAIVARAPADLKMFLPDTPEPEPTEYRLHGLATSSSVVLGLLALVLAAIAILAVSIGWSEHSWPAYLVGGLFAASVVPMVRAIHRRLQVPSRWRAVAATRGRSGVHLDSRIARASRPTLWAALTGTIVIAVAVNVAAVAGGRPPNGVVVALALVVGGAIGRELRRRQ
jgi:hypothetical protein